MTLHCCFEHLPEIIAGLVRQGLAFSASVDPHSGNATITIHGEY